VRRGSSTDNVLRMGIENGMMAIQPFTIHVPDEVLADLRERLTRTRWPEELPGAAWD